MSYSLFVYLAGLGNRNWVCSVNRQGNSLPGILRRMETGIWHWAWEPLSAVAFPGENTRRGWHIVLLSLNGNKLGVGKRAQRIKHLLDWRWDWVWIPSAHANCGSSISLPGLLEQDGGGDRRIRPPPPGSQPTCLTYRQFNSKETRSWTSGSPLS